MAEATRHGLDRETGRQQFCSHGMAEVMQAHSGQPSAVPGANEPMRDVIGRPDASARRVRPEEKAVSGDLYASQSEPVLLLGFPCS